MRLILVELNEINFDVVQYYIDSGVSLPSMKHIIDSEMIVTSAESEYKNLEPWIQWVSVYTGKTAEQHKIFRLGDIERYNEKSFFNTIENLKKSVGVVCSMNLKNTFLLNNG